MAVNKNDLVVLQVVTHEESQRCKESKFILEHVKILDINKDVLALSCDTTTIL